MQGDPENVKGFLKGAAKAAGLADGERDMLAADYKSLQAELTTLFGPVKPHHGMTWNASMLARIAEVLIEKEDSRPFQVRFDGPPGPEAGKFVEVEDRDGNSIRKGRWEQDGEYWLLIVE